MKPLEKINWTDKLSIDNKQVDKDHLQLLNVYNDLVDLIEINKTH